MAPPTNIRSYLQQQHAIAAAAAAAASAGTAPPTLGRKGPAPTSEQHPRLTSSIELIDQAPPAAEVVRSYDEIDQIYDYIRGLAPLPDNLRRMKSIDFEQLEQRERQKRLQQQELRQLALERRFSEQQQQQQQQQAQHDNQLSSGGQRQAAITGRKSAKSRQREQAERAPAAPPLALRITAGETRRPTVKRVESLNLKQAGGEAAGRKQAEDRTGPSYLISSPQRGQQFRLPRARSTSSLSKQQLAIGAPPAQGSQRLASIVCSDLVESYVDDDEDEEEEDDEPRSVPAAVSGGQKVAGSSAGESSSSSSPEFSERAPSTSRSPSSRATRSSGGARRGNHSGAAERPGRRPAAAAREEHVYEQIPAHQDLHHLIARRAVEASATPRPAEPKEGPARRREPTGAPEGARGGQPINYPLAYSANVAANARYQQQVAALFACQQRQRQAARDRHQHQHQPNYLEHQQAELPISQFSAQLANAHHPLNPAARGQNSMPRSLSQVALRQRLSIGNLHLQSAAIPMASLHAGQQSGPRTQASSAYQAASNSIGRSSSSSRVNKFSAAARPLELPSGELIARIQMPRAVSKPQINLLGQPRAQLAKGGQQRHRPSEPEPTSDLRQRLSSAYLWQQPLRASVKQQAPALKVSEGGSLSRLANKRASSRRLTAIGIEQSLELIGAGRLALPPTPLPLALPQRQQPRQERQQQQQEAPPAQRQTRAHLPAARASFFEPTQLMRAPLIDAEEPEEETAAAAAGELSAQSSSAASSQAGAEVAGADEEGRREPLATVQAAARRADSISDLHSYSSSSSSASSSQTTQSSGSSRSSESSFGQKSGASATASEPSASSSSSSASANSSGELEAQTANSERETTSRDTERAREIGSARRGQSEATAAAELKHNGATGGSGRAHKEGSLVAKPKRLGSKLFSNGERLLSLIGLDTIGVGSARGGDERGHKAAAKRVGLAARRTSAPPTPLASKQHQQRRPSASSTGARRRSSGSGAAATGGTSASERTMARAPRPPLVSHFEHPIVEVAKVPGGGVEVGAELGAKVKRKGSSGKLQEAGGSSGATDSTSSYEAAIKNSAERRQLTAVAGSGVPSPPPQTSSSLAKKAPASHAQQQQASTLIRVPKLSKQSHLLNRPLPKVPAGRAGLSPSAGAAVTSLVHSRPSGQTATAGRPATKPASLQSPTSYTQTLNSRGQHRNLAASANTQHVSSALATRSSPANRADLTGSLQGRPGQRYASSQQQQQQSKRSPLSTNLDAEPAGLAEATAAPRQRQRKSEPKSSSGQQLRLSSLSAVHPSPTVTTYTSSGISSTHLATNASSSSSQRSKASSDKGRQPQRELVGKSAAARRAASSSSNTLEGSSSWQQSGDERSEEGAEEEEEEDDDEMDMIDEHSGNSISPDIMRFDAGDNAARRGHLKSFDERFSSKYIDQHLASSSDSLLESINFSGTLDSSARRRKQKPAITTTKRFVDIIKRPDETAEERAYRVKYEQLQDWNNKYWSENNELFNREKESYIRRNFGHLNEEQALSHDQLATFYRDFLERNRDRHVNYNRTWYKNHISLLADSIEAKLSRLRANLQMMK